MKKEFSTILGTVYFKGNCKELAGCFSSQNISTETGEWAVRFPWLSGLLSPGYVELQYEGNFQPEAPYEFEGSGWSLENMVQIGGIISDALTKLEIKHEIEVCNEAQETVQIYQLR